jgi:hypothetical protein
MELTLRKGADDRELDDGEEEREDLVSVRDAVLLTAVLSTSPGLTAR